MDQQINTYRKLLATGISSVLLECGFDTVDKDSLGTLTEIIQCFISELGSLSKNYCELSCRNEPLIADVILGFTEMGFDFSNLEGYVKGITHAVLPVLQPQQPLKQLNMLPAGTKQPLPSHIPQHLPQFPDPHAYVRTPTHKQPIIDYESVREKAAIQKKEVEKALTKFLAKTSTTTHNLFDSEETNIFPLIACKPNYPPYLSALLPQDQIFDAEDLEYDPKTQLTQQAKQPKPKEKKKEASSQVELQDALDESIKSEENNSPSIFIDNPYLAATKLPMNETMEVS